VTSAAVPQKEKFISSDLPIAGPTTRYYSRQFFKRLYPKIPDYTGFSCRVDAWRTMLAMNFGAISLEPAAVILAVCD
jgi:hypothetical protein